MQTTTRNDNKIETFACREIIPLKLDFFWLLKKGIVKTYTWSDEGAIITLGYWGSEDVVGQPLSLVHPYKIECLTPVEAFCIPLNQSHCLLDSIHRHIQQTEEMLYIVRSGKMYQRLRKMLFWLADKFGQEVEKGKLIKLRLTHQDLANTIGTTRVTVTKLMNQLEEEGVIFRTRRNGIVLRS
jgi:CRP-like cAMP-binding protein